MPQSSAITDVAVATIQGQLPAPVVFGDWIMKQREFVVGAPAHPVRLEGWAFTLTRDGAVAEQIRKTIAPVYVGSDVADRAKTWRTAWRRSLASHCGGVGLRALSIVDLAAWDAAAKIADKSIAEFLGGTSAADAGDAPSSAIRRPRCGPRKTGRAGGRALCRRLAALQGADRGDAGTVGGAPPRGACCGAGCLARLRRRLDLRRRRQGGRRSPTRIADVKLGWHRGHLPARRCRQARRAPQARADADLAWATSRAAPITRRR